MYSAHCAPMCTLVPVIGSVFLVWTERKLYEFVHAHSLHSLEGTMRFSRMVE